MNPLFDMFLTFLLIFIFFIVKIPKCISIKCKKFIDVIGLFGANILLYISSFWYFYSNIYMSTFYFIFGTSIMIVNVFILLDFLREYKNDDI